MLSVKPAKDDQILILIATFDQPGIGLPVSSKPQEEIQRALVKAMGEYGLSQVIVNTIPIVVSVDDKKRAIYLGKRYNASAIIWGSETGVRITVNYLNL